MDGCGWVWLDVESVDGCGWVWMSVGGICVGVFASVPACIASYPVPHVNHREWPGDTWQVFPYFIICKQLHSLLEHSSSRGRKLSVMASVQVTTGERLHSLTH